MVRILATADWQMDMLAGGLNSDARKYLTETRVTTIERLLEIAKEEEVDAILAAGDLFEYPRPTPEIITAVATVLQRSTVPIHAIPGNHDLYGSSSVWNTPEFRAIEHFHLHNEVTKTQISEGVFLHSIPVKSKFDMQSQEEHLDDVSREEGVHIVMAHAHDISVGTFGGHEDDCTLPIDSSNVIDKGYSLVILGHWHSWLEVQASRVLYPGTHEQTKFGERDAGYVAVIDIPKDGSEPQILKKKVGQIQWESTEFDCTGRNLPGDIIDFIRNLRDEGTDFLKLKLIGEVDVDTLASAIPEAKEACGPMVRHLEFNIDQMTTIIDIESMTDKVNLPLGLREIQSSILADLESARGSEELTDKLMDELYALYRSCRAAGIIEE